MKIYVVFRYDDFSNASDIQLENEIIGFFNERSIGFTIGVIPFIDSLPLTEPKKLLLKETLHKENCEIALHGFSHKPHFGYSEFKKRPFRMQLRLIKKGKNYLEDSLSVKIETFIPPFNSYDRNTIRALKQLNFNIISSSLGGYIPINGIGLMPYTCTLEYFDYILDFARHYINFNPVIVVVFHPFDFHDKRNNIDRLKVNKFKKTIERLSSQEEIQIATLKKLAGLLKGKFSGTKFFFNKVLEKINDAKITESRPYSKVYWGIAGSSYFSIKSMLNMLNKRAKCLR